MNQKKRKSYILIFRKAVQLIFFFLLPGLYVNAFLGIKILIQGLIGHDLNLSESFPQLVSAASILPLTLLSGRFFCGWMCAFGTLGDLLHLFSRRVLKIRYRIDEETDRYLKYIKYALFVFIVVAVWGVQAFAISSLSPWDAFGSLLTFTGLPDFSFVITEITIGFILLVIVMIGSLFVERFFCRYLCPLGAVFAIISHLKFLKLQKPTKNCGNCKACTRNCSMGIPLHQSESVTSGECINCMKCVAVCPRENVHATIAATVTSPAVAGALAVTAMTGIYYFGNLASDAGIPNNPTVTETAASITPTAKAAASITPAASESTGNYVDGTYQGSGTGFRGRTTTVSVTVSGGMITDIQAVSYGDDRRFFVPSFQTIKNDIISAQNTDVDTVSGATFSSMGIMDAVEDALSNAAID